jgi:Kef-type K+ transport system membrane component KefB
MFSSLFFGLILSALGLFRSTTESDLFRLLETLGMYLLLFIIGYSIDFKKMARLKNCVILGTKQRSESGARQKTDIAAYPFQ